MKKHEIIFSTIKLPLDFAIVFLAFFVARELRLVKDFIPVMNLPVQTINTESLFYYSLFWWIIYILLFWSHQLYNSKISNSKIKEFLDIVRYSIYFLVFFSVIVYYTKWFLIFKHNEIPRLIIIFATFISALLMILERIILNWIQYKLLQKWIIEKRKLLIINSKDSREIEEILDDIKASKIYEIIWYANKEKIDSKLKFIWWLKEIENKIYLKEIDEILYIDSDFKKKELYNIWDLAKIFWIRYRYITNSFDITKTNSSLSLINKIPVIEIENSRLWIWWRVIKRLFDIIFSIFWIILFSPIIILVAILIKIEDPKWPIIYKNRRVWLWWTEFNVFKFRYIKWEYCIKDSYWVKEEDDKALLFEQKLIKEKSTRKWPLYKIKNDPRKTKVWKFIEKYSIDELPQFFNVFIWNMSIVWPRPHQPREVEKYELWEKRVLVVKPWITGMAQVNGREKNNFEDEAKLDIFYIENWNILLDLKIILKTPFTTLKR